jgi:hypothetical protein
MQIPTFLHLAHEHLLISYIIVCIFYRSQITASSGVMGANYYDDDEEDDEDYVPGMRRNRYDDSDYDEISFDFDVDETSEDDVVSMYSP